MFDYELIASNIKEHRERLGYSFQDLANKTGMSKSTLQRYETGGIKNIPIARLRALSMALECDIDEIIGLPVKRHETGNSDSLTLQELKIARAYSNAISPVKRTVEVALEPFMEEADEEMVRVFSAAKSYTNKDASVTNVPRSTIEKLKAAPEVDEI